MTTHSYFVKKKLPGPPFGNKTIPCHSASQLEKTTSIKKKDGSSTKKTTINPKKKTTNKKRMTTKQKKTTLKKKKQSAAKKLAKSTAAGSTLSLLQVS
jgi:hypothetical protein